MGKKWIGLRIDENLLEKVLGLEKDANSKTEAIERRLKKSLIL